ncbi:MAG: hypothetical protein ABSG64_00730 [Solirubrobacteraceae bacterium]|jgi:hypothetical protein
MEAVPARDARAEAAERARTLRGADCEVRILEPAPPAVDEPPWFADHEPAGERIVSPFGALELRWETLAAEDPSLRRWCEERWLGPYRRLAALPAHFASTRDALHELAEQVISPAREQANTKIGLRWTLGGFGTPFFADDVQVRVEHGALVVQKRASATRAPITTLQAARELLGDLAAPARNNASTGVLEVDPAAATALGDWFGFATSVLEELRYGVKDAVTQLWPEHFDVSVELGSEGAGQRAGYGSSPGDDEHPVPYLYVAPWGQTPEGDRWQAIGFSGAELGYDALLATDDQRGLALAFYRGALADLAAAR